MQDDAAACKRNIKIATKKKSRRTQKKERNYAPPNPPHPPHTSKQPGDLWSRQQLCISAVVSLSSTQFRLWPAEVLCENAAQNLHRCGSLLGMRTVDDSPLPMWMVLVTRGCGHLSRFDVFDVFARDWWGNVELHLNCGAERVHWSQPSADCCVVGRVESKEASWNGWGARLEIWHIMDGYFPRFRFQTMWLANVDVDTKLCRLRRIDP